VVNPLGELCSDPHSHVHCPWLPIGRPRRTRRLRAEEWAARPFIGGTTNP
jgi:hypothetical protein